MREGGIAHAVALLREATGDLYELVGRLTGGETGAHELRRARDGQRVVLKWETDSASQELRREAVELTERLRTEAAWPVPEQSAFDTSGCLLILQSFMPGDQLSHLTPGLADQLLRLHETRFGLGEPGAGARWAQRLVRTLVEGGRSYCLHDSLRGYDVRTASLVDEIERFGMTVNPGDLGGCDIVHWDLHPQNVLAEGDHVSAIVDTDFCSVGDAAFDLVMLALTSSGIACDAAVQRDLFHRALDPLPLVRRRAYLGHLFIRALDWPIRRGNADEVEHWLSQVERCRTDGYF